MNKLLGPAAQLDFMLIELTSRCNLRCSYCPKGQPGNDLVPGRDQDMDLEVFEATRRLVEKYRPGSLLLAGTGETTFAKNWTELCRPFLSIDGASKILNTNLVREYSGEDLDFLLGFDQLVVSLDTSVAQTLRLLRSKSDIKTIVYNIAALRARATLNNTRTPRININCTVTSKSRLELSGLAALCAAIKVDYLQFSDVIEYPNAASVLDIRSTASLPMQERLETLEELNSATEICTRNGIAFGIQPSLEQSLRDSSCHELAPTGRNTRICYQPWTRLNIAADGQYFPCCVTEQPSLGRIQHEEDPVNSEAIRIFRERLLSGDMPEACRNCTNAPLGGVDALAKWVSEATRNSARPMPAYVVRPVRFLKRLTTRLLR